MGPSLFGYQKGDKPVLDAHRGLRKPSTRTGKKGLSNLVVQLIEKQKGTTL